MVKIKRNNKWYIGYLYLSIRRISGKKNYKATPQSASIAKFSFFLYNYQKLSVVHLNYKTSFTGAPAEILRTAGQND
jgi:hypothetical protein